MRKYDSYINSGIDWLGEIPKHWAVKRAKYIFDYINRGTSPSYVDFSDFKVINQATFSKGFFNQENIRYTDKISNMDNFAREKDILIASTGGGVLGKVHYFDEKYGNYVPDSHITILRGCRKRINTKYYYYFLSIHFHLINEQLALGSTNQTELQKKYLFDFKLVYPEFKVQTAIAQYLDAKTEAIDKKVGLLEKKIDGYKKLKKSLINEVVTKGLNKNVKRKDSGIDWIDQIPEHWDVKRLKDISLSLTSGATPTSGNPRYYENGEVNWLNTGDLNDGIIDRTVKKLHPDVFLDYPNLKLQKRGTLIIAMYGATIGKMGILDIEATTNQACCCISLRMIHNTKYYFYQLLSNKENLVSLSVGGTQPNVSQSILGFIPLAVPPKSEQQAIASYLDKKTNTIDKIVRNIQTQISTLKTLRKTLINDVVTGKIKVCDD